jgi:hypothetical protein
MSDELCALHNYALALRQINMLQVAGDFDYLAAWLNSSEWTDGSHLKPDPAGENTIDAYSNNCPIPYTACRKITDCCTDLYTASNIVNSAKSLIQSLLDIYTDEVEQTAIKVYLDYVDDLIYLIDGVEPEPPTPPVPTYEEMIVWVRAGQIQPHVTNSLGGGGNTHAGAVTTNVHYLNTDNSMLNQIRYQAGKRYEFGSYQGSTWVKYRTTIPEMPAITTSDVSTTQYGFIPYEDSRGYLCCWYVSNYTNNMNWGERSLRMRVYDDTETEVTVYKNGLRYKAQTSVRSSTTPASAFLGDPLYRLYMDAARTIPMPYDNTKKYKFAKNYDTYYTLDEFLAGSEQSTMLIINNNGFAYVWVVTKSWAGGDRTFTYYDEQIKIADV